jgi:hypothetical protein
MSFKFRSSIRVISVPKLLLKIEEMGSLAMLMFIHPLIISPREYCLSILCETFPTSKLAETLVNKNKLIIKDINSPFFIKE